MKKNDRQHCVDIIVEEDSVVGCYQNLHENKMDVELNWLALPDDIFSIVANKLTNNRDYIRFGAVCASWRGIYLENRELLLREPLFLMVAAEHDQDGQTRSLYSFSEKRFYKEFPLPIPHNLHCASSSHGWIVTVSASYEVSLINPLLSLQNKIQLPPLTTFEEEDVYRVSFLNKAVLSNDPISNPNYTVMAIYGQYQKISFYKPGDKAWTPFDPSWPVPYSCRNLFSDIIYDEDKFYALDRFGRAISFDVSDPSSVMLIAKLDSQQVLDQGKSYLVKSGTDILRVVRNIEYEDVFNSEYYLTLRHGFTVFKLEPTSCKWTKVNSLDGRILFLGFNDSISLSASDMPGCMPNCIYFTDDNDDYDRSVAGGHDMGVFNLEDGSITHHYPVSSRLVFPWPIIVNTTDVALLKKTTQGS